MIRTTPPRESCDSPDALPTPPDDDRYLRLVDLARYASLSVRTLQRLIVDPDDPLPVSRLGRATFVRKSDYDRWLANRQHRSRAAGADLSDDDRRIALALRGYPAERR
jgi:predicted DNA-binding transcriptional regulator AlpA